MEHSKAVREFYENNTAAFLRWGKHEQTSNIHQPLWAEGVSSSDQAVNYSNQLVLQAAQELAKRSPKEPLNCIDLGCGVGSSLLYLLQNGPSNCQGWGITISPAQVKLAKEFQAKLGIESASFQVGDFLQWPKDLPPMDLAYAIEAFLHAADPRAFFQAAADGLKPGGRLILIDDFLSKKGSTGKLSQKQSRNLAYFRHGWMAGSLISGVEAEALAGEFGLQLRRTLNLTPYMRLGRPRDKVIGMMSAVAGKWMQRSTYFKMMHGGYAKQQSLKQDLLRYQLMEWKKA
ncbi:MAG: class I SAM-dependent methyltransferase [Bacteroidota bacterium]